MIQERIPKVVYQFVVQSATEQGLDLARAVLLNVGYAPTDIISSSLKNKPSIELFSEEKEKLVKLEQLFKRLKLDRIKVSLRSLKPAEWLTLWKTQWKPAALTKKLDVVPVWYQDKYKVPKGRDYILMDTLLSFGTGLHETTRFMSQLIEDSAGKYKSFLDIGTGTGILCFVALKNGAKEVLAIDIGELSVKASRDNMKVNNLYFKVLKADIKKYRLPKIFDFVAANLVTEDLIANAPKIISFVKEGGLLAVSGISLDNLSRLRKAFSSLPLKCLKVCKGEQWSGLLYQRTML